MFHHHPNGSLTHLRRVRRSLLLLCHRSTLSKKMASGKPGAVHMLDQYGAEGFGVMTSGPIDATLYDKLDAVCLKRGVEQLHHSGMELERRLVRYPAIRSRYFTGH